MIADLAGRRADAGRLYAAAQAEMPEMSLRLAQVLASWQARNGNPDQARRILANLGSGSPEVAISLPGLNRVVGQRAVSRATDGLAEAYLELAAALRPQESGDFAMVMTRLALALRPDFTAARLLASEIQAGRHHDAAALQLLAVVPAADPLAPLVRLRRAALTDRTGHTEEAMQALDHLAAEYPNSPAPLIERGDLLRARKHFKEAIGVYTRALAHIQESRDVEWLVLYSRGISYERSGEWPLGEADLRHALRLSPDQPSVLNYLGYSWAERGEHLKEAREMIQKAAERRPHDGAIVDSLGWVMLRQGEVAAAVHMLERAVELEPEDPTITAHLGDAYWAAGRKLEAQYQWRRALTLNPTADDVVKLEAKLQAPQKASVVSGQ
jgi:tetratricopeptide (TPR) repeat protein